MLCWSAASLLSEQTDYISAKHNMNVHNSLRLKYRQADELYKGFEICGITIALAATAF